MGRQSPALQEQRGGAGFVTPMKSDNLTPASQEASQQARLRLRLGRHAGLDMRLRLTSGGILAIGGLVSSILLSTAVLVAVSIRESRN